MNVAVIQLNIMKPLEQADNQNSFALSSLMVMVSFVAIWIAAFNYSVEIGVLIGVSIVPATIFLAVVERYGRKPKLKRSKLRWLALLLTMSAVFFVSYLLSFGPFLAYWDTLPPVEYNEKNGPAWQFYLLADRIAYEFPVSNPLKDYLNLWSPYDETISAAGR